MWNIDGGAPFGSFQPAVRKVNELVKRCRLAKAHAFVVSHLKKEMPSMWGKEKAQRKLLDNLEEHFLKVA